MNYGLENEFFVYNKDGEVTSVNTTVFPYDESGYLVEARGKPFNSILEAVFSLKAEIFRINKIAAVYGYTLKTIPLEKIPPKVMLRIRREFTKGVTSYQNLYGFETHRNGSLATAGLHISFTDPHEVEGKDGYKVVINELFDYVQLFRHLDQAFRTEIREAKRNPGFYEIKADGRIEYRSLPNNVNLDKVIEVVQNYRF